jgi:hypothetical protein
LVSSTSCAFESNEGLVSAVAKDMEDLKHDQEVLKTGQGETRLLCSRPCPAPSNLCRISKGRCLTCHKREGPSFEVSLLMSVSEMMDGGMPVAAGDLDAAQWRALSRIRAGKGIFGG